VISGDHLHTDACAMTFRDRGDGLGTGRIDQADKP